MVDIDSLLLESRAQTDVKTLNFANVKFSVNIHQNSTSEARYILTILDMSSTGWRRESASIGVIIIIIIIAPLGDTLSTNCNYMRAGAISMYGG